MGLKEQLQWEDKVKAEQGLMSSYFIQKTPEQSAMLLNKAKELRMTPEQAALVTPEEDAERLTNKANIAGIQAMAPVLVEKMREPNFANVVREDLGNMSLMESAIWKLSTAAGIKPKGAGRSAANSWTRSIQGLFRNETEAIDLKERIDEIKAKQALIANGTSPDEVFAGKDEEETILNAARFKNELDSLPELEKQYEIALEKKRYQEWSKAQYPVSDATQKFFANKDDWKKAADAFFEDPLQIAADILPESVVQYAPALAGAAIATAVGAPVAASAALAGLYSAALDYKSQVDEGVKDAGVDYMEPKKAGQALTSGVIDEARRKAGAHALSVGAFDALSLGVASKVLLPKALVARWAEAPAKKHFANMAVQVPLGGALGGAGEAGGQLLAEGKITSWADIYAEIAGEGFMAPIEVASTSLEARSETLQNKARAELKAQAAQKLNEALKASSAVKIDPSTVEAHMEEVAQRSGLTSVSIDGTALEVLSEADSKALSPEVKERIKQAKQNGTSVELPLPQALALMNENPEVAGYLSFNGEPSVNEAAIQDEEVKAAAARQLAAARSATAELFNAEVADVGRLVGEQVLKATGSEEETQALQAIVQSFVAANALDLDMSPKQFWQEYGASILGEPDVKRDAKGNLVEVEGKNPSLWKADAFSQSWGRLERFKISIIDIKDKFVGNYKDLAKHLKSLSGKELKLGVSGTATLNGRGIREIVSRPDPTRVVDENVFKTAVSNLEQLLANSFYGWSAPDRKNRPAIDHVEKHFSGFIHRGKPYAARITVRVISEPKVGKKVYEVDAIEIESLDSGLNWVNQAYAKDKALTKNSSVTEATEEGTRRRANPLHDVQSITPMSPDVQELIEALSHLRNGSFSQASRGDFYPELKLIARWKSADRSTLLHETGHMFLEARMQAYADMLKRGGPKTEGEKHFAENMQKVLKFVGVKSPEQWQSMSTDQKRKGHEKFARSFEAWLMLGKAPSENLQGVFAQFASWLKKLYMCLSGIPGAQFDESVQDMFSNMFLAEAQIREAAIRQNVEALFATAEEAGMTPEEFESYHQSVNDMIAEAEAEQTERNTRLSERVNAMRRKALRELQGEVKGELKRIRDEEQKAFEATDTYKAWDKIHNGAAIGGKKVFFKLSMGELLALGFTKRQVEELHKAGLAVKQPRKGGLPIDDLAAGLNYPDAKTMVEDLLNNLKPKDIINQRAADRFVRENPELATPQQVQDAAGAALFNDAKIKVLTAELKAFLRMARKQNVAINNEQMAALAEEAVSKMKYSDIKPSKYITEANRAKREARQLWAKGDIDGAIRAKRKELGFALMAKAAKQALTYRSKTRRSFDKFKAKVKKSVDQRHWELIQRALANMGLFTEKQLSLNPEGQSFERALHKLEAETGANLDQLQVVTDAITRADTAFLETPEGFTQFKEFTAALEKLGRDEKHFTLEDKKIELDEIEKDGADSIRAVADQHGRGAKRLRERSGKSERFKNWLIKFGLSQARASALIAVLDGAYDGILTKLIIHPYGHCANKQAELQAKFSKEVDRALSPILKDLRSRRRVASKTFNGAEFTVEEAFTILLNYGNEGNRQRIAETLAVDFGIHILEDHDPKDPAAVAQAWAKADAVMDAFFQEMLPDERFYKAAEAVWDTFEKSRQEVDKVIKRMNGRTPLWVQPMPVQIGNRTLKGGYYPIVYDRKASLSGACLASVDGVNSMQSIFSNQGVADGHLKGRLTKYKKPVVLTTRALFEGLNEQTYYCAYAEFMNDMRKLLNPDSPIAKAIHERYGSEYYQAIIDWLKDVRENGRGKTTSYDGVATLLRHGVSIAGIGFNFGVAAIQVVGLTQSAALLAPRWLSRGMAEAMKHGTNANAWVCGKSAMMRDRTRTQFREVSEISSRINGASTVMAKLQEAAYAPLTMVQLMVDIPTWFGAYEKALHEGHSDAEAVDLADWAVMNSQGSGRPGDLSAVERGNPWQKLFTVFYTFFNTALNLAVVSGKTQSTMKAAAQILTICILQPVLEYGIREAAASLLGQEDEDDEDEFWVKHLKGAAIASLQFDAGMVWGVREFASAMSDYGYRGPTAMRKITDSVKAIKDAQGILFEDKEFTERALRDFISALGSWTGIPVSPINKAIKGYNLIEEGESDSYFSLVTGK